MKDWAIRKPLADSSKCCKLALCQVWISKFAHLINIGGDLSSEL